ncbi:LOW QUALITY PROTEIN: DNA replication ATP-dependent helicase/nuclease DNA2 [Rhagoletis pomonella]|uniref:LOW QUALITY PROTEIN: DNA replication ATP-dependent helicase/nuclease DNA2 n=1 Tax=Rhagoletis pomonella TaxID=28610 RepID=UPI00177C652F|nr:LOW QUALITY PROTEIN: DNA replication ATP-dependent helicase/nuclease DNA2 [Rhagoletis pomonella]
MIQKKAKRSNSECKIFDEDLNTSFDKLFDADDDFESIINGRHISVDEDNKFDLSKWQRCTVVEAERKRPSFDLVLQVCKASNDQIGQHGKENNTVLTRCHLQQQWSQTEVKAGDIVFLQAFWDDELRCYKVNNELGFCVTNPDTLISSTSVVGSLFCRRKVVLQDRFKGIDANSKVMIVGSMAHEMLQIVLKKRLTTSQEIKNAAQELLECNETAYELYANLMTRDELALELRKFIPNMITFVDQYIKGNTPLVQHKDNFQGTIEQIQDIEENLWVPQLGLKGKIDVSVRIKHPRYEKVSNTIPLELKTGRATFSMEHKGQVMLYQMMLSAIGRETNSSLLLYLRECIMRELRGTRNEQRDLIMLRNELAHFISYQNSIAAADKTFLMSKEGKFVQPIKLPDPISHHSACGNCEYATICCTFARTDPELLLRNGHPLKNVMQTVTEHLREEDYKYFMHWCTLLVLEEQEIRKSHNLRTLWTNTPEQRQKKGLAITDVQLHEVSCEGSHYLHNFDIETTNKHANVDLLLSGFSIGEYVIVSTCKRLAVAAGCIANISNTNITISLERDLRQNYKQETFIIDKHESQSGNSFNFTNVSLLLDNTDRANMLREIVVHRMQPIYHKVLPQIVASVGAPILKQLNSVQRSAVLKALTTESYMLIKGLPGTGKTQTLVAIVRLLHLMGKSVLVTSHTHSAVDNLLVRLKPYKLPMLRLGSGARINVELQEFGERVLLKECHSVESITQKYNSYNIVGVTCLGSSHPLFLHRKYDFCIVDEATQVMQSTNLRPLFFCDKFILVGDPDQLPPLIRSKKARQLGADESLFERLDTETATSVLTLQYRMNKTITRLANELTYNGTLQCASKQVELDAFQLNMSNATKTEKWLQRVLQTHIDQAVFLLDTIDCTERLNEFANERHNNTLLTVADSLGVGDVEKVCTESPVSNAQKTGSNMHLSKYNNFCEAAVIMHIVEQLLKAGYAAERIGIIAPYRAQVELLRKLTLQYDVHYRDEFPNINFGAVEVNTVDQYQGRDKDVILFSGTKTGAVEENERASNAEILEDKRRLTVAITRAKRKLLLVGDAACLNKYTPFHLLLGLIPSYCKLRLEDGKLGFDWKALLNHLANIIKT